MRVVKKRFLIRKECKIGNAGLAKIDSAGRSPAIVGVIKAR